jgi:hypothetical protein
MRSPCSRVRLYHNKSAKSYKVTGINIHSAGSITNSSSSVSASDSFSGAIATPFARPITVLANFCASWSSKPQHTKLPLENMNTSPSLPLPGVGDHFGTQRASCSILDEGGRRCDCARSLESRYFSAVASVETGRISLRVVARMD